MLVKLENEPNFSDLYVKAVGGGLILSGISGLYVGDVVEASFDDPLTCVTVLSGYNKLPRSVKETVHWIVVSTDTKIAPSNFFLLPLTVDLDDHLLMEPSNVIHVDFQARKRAA